MLQMLIVDDEPLVLLTIKSLCNWEDQEIRIAGEAENGKIALEFIKANPEIDIVITDVDMPVMNGLEFAEALQKENLHPVVIFLSSYSNFEYVRTAFKSGACEYILKSELEAGSLLEIIRRIPVQRIQDRQDVGGINSHENFRSDFFNAILGDIEAGFDSLFENCAFSVSFPFHFMILRPGDMLLVRERYETKLYDFQKTVRDLLMSFINRTIGDCGALSFDQYYIFMKDLEKMEATFELFYKAAWTYIDIGFEGKIGKEVADVFELKKEFAQCLNGFLPPSRLVIRSRRYIREHFSDPDLSLSRIAEHNHVSKNHLSFEFTRETGETVMDFLTRMRIGEAEKLIVETNLRIYEVAEKCGYLNVETFNRAFKRITGKSPSRFV